MISDFDLLSQKVDELARLAHALRRENAGLRASLAVVGAEKDELAQRMQLAQQRVGALLARLPAQAEWNPPEPEGVVVANGVNGPVGPAFAEAAGVRVDAPADPVRLATLS